jgi:hypothetical protein
MKKYLIATVVLVSSLVFGQDKPKTETPKPPTTLKMPAAVNTQHKSLRDLADKKRLEIDKATAELRAAQSEAREIDRALQDVFKEGLKQLGIPEEQFSNYDVRLEKDEIILTPKLPSTKAPSEKKENGG